MRSKQSKRKTKICKICFKNIEDNSFHCLLNFETKICRDCFNKFKVEFSHFKISNKDVLSLYEYDEFITCSLSRINEEIIDNEVTSSINIKGM